MSTFTRDEAGQIVIRLDAATERDLVRLGAEPTRDFNAMVEAARLDPAKDFRQSNFAGIPLAGADLRGFDFTGADLQGCQIRRARVDQTTRMMGARLDTADRRALAKLGVFRAQG